MKTGQCLIDAFSCTLHGISVSKCIEDVLHLGDLNWLENSIGRYGYHRTTFFGSIRIFSDGRPDMGILLELQGQGCRELEMLSKNSSIFYCILSSIIPTRISLTRIDIAVDDFNQRLSLDQIRQKVDILVFCGVIAHKTHIKLAHRGVVVMKLGDDYLIHILEVHR